MRYSYRVDAQEFVNDYIHPKRIQLPRHSTKEWAQKRAESFSDDVTVHYNPATPDESFLVQTPKRTLYVVTVVSSLVVVFWLMLLLTL